MKNLLKTALIVLINNALFMGSSAVSLTAKPVPITSKLDCSKN